MKVQVVPARPEHCFVLATTMREKDVAELEVCGLTPIDGLLQSLQASEAAWTLLHDDVVGAMFGVEAGAEQALGRTDRLWFLTGHLFAEKPLAFVKAARVLLSQLLERWPALSNVIDARHDDALRFAAAMGADFFEPVPFGRRGEPFVPFILRSA